MAELGLIPNATLHLKCTGKPSPPTTLNITSDMAQALKAITAGTSSGVSKMLGGSGPCGINSSMMGMHGGLPTDYGGCIGSSGMEATGIGPSTLDNSALLSGMSSALGSGLPHTLSSSILGLGGVPSQYYCGNGMSAAVVAAASLSRQPGLSTLVSCSTGPIPSQTGDYTLTSSHSSPRSHPTATTSSYSGGTPHYPSPSPRRSPSPALPIIPPNLHPALTSTLPHLFLSNDAEDSSSDNS